jgi:hypothetical protein
MVTSHLEFQNQDWIQDDRERFRQLPSSRAAAGDEDSLRDLVDRAVEAQASSRNNSMNESHVSMRSEVIFIFTVFLFN